MAVWKVHVLYWSTGSEKLGEGGGILLDDDAMVEIGDGQLMVGRQKLMPRGKSECVRPSALTAEPELKDVS